MDEWTKDQGRGTAGQEWMTQSFSSSDQNLVPTDQQQPGDVWPQNFSSLGLSFLNCEMGIIVLPTSLDCFED